MPPGEGAAQRAPRPGGPLHEDSHKEACIFVRRVTEVTAIVVYSTQIQMNQEVIWETGISV
jgi:hypothetical protein